MTEDDAMNLQKGDRLIMSVKGRQTFPNALRHATFVRLSKDGLLVVTKTLRKSIDYFHRHFWEVR